ncbi:oxygen-independent coproporphyrinogen III oxidase [Actimicrobium sp. CCI2.3]|uniref:oxygen-independent coproporphyrinogen III oxidase n=1 Tax=Actimicrobium sp. CCI2.3 TaxID=3048616 RepID=UPI002AB44522|nr:oxygen-independent coproporphyrinogen III oxidase [Actimicrobium sp. CCI2.3]MDY7575478.1 oxygen-independent coproporphyrinogen III oxidase [Actimicrobium sp. CCI2.3]MEB0024033.1 oxygen-independent coproporphyrinogen III oxidase [Actimicrobium sp. CCI2.3]
MVSLIPVTSVPSVKFDAALIGKFIGNVKQQGPRYTSYPTADHFTDAFRYRDYLQAVAGRRTRGGRKPLSLYLHIPFCDTVCYYCACNKIVTKKVEKAATYLTYLKREIEMQGQLFADMNQVEQVHLGGGTPTYFSDVQMDDLMAHVRRWFKLAPDDIGEYAIEVDPRTVSRERVFTLRRQGFNRISLGVQDFDPDVQQAVNRVQPESETLAIIEAARDATFRSISIDLIYGLPKQNVMTMARTLTKVIAASPDRIAIYNYAHLPHLFKPQRRILDADLPGAATRLDMLALCIRRLTEAGYVYIGMDHFARPTDDLAIAQGQGRLHRNFQGYSTHAELDLVSCGVSAISAVAATYSQNVKTLDAYYAHLDKNELPIVRGIKLSMDDLLRRAIIQLLMCNFEMSIASIEQAYPITVATYFAAELAQLQVLAQDGLLTMDDEWISVTPQGRLLIRTICMVFDRYLSAAVDPLRYSKTI